MRIMRSAGEVGVVATNKIGYCLIPRERARRIARKFGGLVIIRAWVFEKCNLCGIFCAAGAEPCLPEDSR
jgi:hypothetical protein